MPTLKIDGQEIQVEKGTTILQAAQRLGIRIPTFCYHPGLSIAANCRMCLVEVAKSPKPMPACHAQCADGMEVFTNTQKVQETQKAILEFILLNHPVDCPICDQAGECVLQDNYADYSLSPSRLFTKKVHKAKAKPLGPKIILDAERCILCTRCVRFGDEITKTGELRVMSRGEHSEITTFPGKTLDNPYSLNVVDICPVGALTSIDFRFKRRVWFMSATRSVCTECARGCNIRIDSFQNKIERYVPNYNPKVNQWWICDSGRMSHTRWTANRVTEPRNTRTESSKTAISTRDVADKMAKALVTSGKASAFVLDASMPNEDAFVALRLARAVGSRLYLGGRAQNGPQDELLRLADRNANRTGISAIAGPSPLPGLAEFQKDVASGAFKTVLFIGGEHEGPDKWAKLLEKVSVIGVLADIRSDLVDIAHIVIPAAVPQMREGTVVNSHGRVQRIRQAIRLEPAGVVFPYWRILKRIATTAGLEATWNSERAIFGEIVASMPQFAEMTYDKLGDLGLPLGSNGLSDVDVDAATRNIDPSAPQYRKTNINSRMPWQH